MPHTREQLVARALRELGIPGAGQTASAEDAQVVDEEIDSVMADLAEREIYNWGDPDQIDDAAAVHLSVILANSVATQFGEETNENKRLMAENRLRYLASSQLSGQPQTTEYF